MHILTRFNATRESDTEAENGISISVTKFTHSLKTMEIPIFRKLLLVGGSGVDGMVQRHYSGIHHQHQRKMFAFSMLWHTFRSLGHGILSNKAIAVTCPEQYRIITDTIVRMPLAKLRVGMPKHNDGWQRDMFACRTKTIRKERRRRIITKPQRVHYEILYRPKIH